MYRLTPLGRAVLAALSIAFTGAAISGSPAFAEADLAAQDATATERLIVKYRDHAGLTAAASNAAQRLAGLQQAATALEGAQLKLMRHTALGSHVLTLDRKLPLARMQALAARMMADDPTIEYAEPDRKMHALATPNDASYSKQWDLYEDTGGIRAPAAWDISTGSGVVVAVIDTGYRPHADLKANIIAGYDFIADTFTSKDGNGRDSDPSDPGDASAAGECGTGSQARNSSWHGTHVAGTIAAVTNNSTGVAGIAYNAKVQPVRVLGRCGGYTSDIADAIVWASGGTVSGAPANATPAKVINMSLGGSGACDSTTQSAINGARSRGTVVVVAAGNSSADVSGFNPANCSGVIAVAATNRYGARASYSNYGAKIALAAPGGETSSSADNGILSTLNSGTNTPGADSYAYYQGTSMASPHVAAVAALMLSKKPGMTPDEVAAKLKSSARPFPGSCSQCGTGILNAQAALTDSTPPPGTNELEPNNSMSAAQAVAAPATLQGNIGASSDQDWFVVNLGYYKQLTATLTPNSSSDYDLYLYDASGNLLAKSERDVGLVDTAKFTNTYYSSQKVYVYVKYYSGGTGATSGKYSLDLRW
ncbi:S8 family peptidase [Ideonella sp.]|uniref:S8 family peptidase n=1 Tax=Ideonella sp. TaxID=1929293 RepID=UPI0035B25859